MKLVNKRKNCSKWSFRPSFGREGRFPNGLIAKHKIWIIIMLHKILSVGANILELRKVVIYAVH